MTSNSPALSSFFTSSYLHPTRISFPEQVDPELELLDEVVTDRGIHQNITAPLITREAHLATHITNVPQYGVLGSVISIHSGIEVEERYNSRLYVNTNTPFSAVICGVQGSGKSHTVGVLLESMLVQRDPRLGSLAKPLAGLVLHVGESGGSCLPCEAAYQAISSDPTVCTPTVKVYVSPSCLHTMEKVYRDTFGDRIRVLPLKFTHDELDAQSFLAMMCVSTGAEPPLYVQIILSLLREMGETFSFTAFKTLLAARKESFNPAQKSGLDQRMAILEAFLDPKAAPSRRFKAGQLTIVDLTDPFVDSAAACSVFDIVTRLFVRSDLNTGKVMVIDEAHKYLTTSRGAATLTKTLLSITRQQRHLGMRMIVSTQEPTVIPSVLLDLCSITIMHRFSSSSWFEHLSKHVSSEFSENAFDAVVQLQTGEAMVLAPAGIGLFSTGDCLPTAKTFGRRYLIIRTRRRVTVDGGSSIMVV